MPHESESLDAMLCKATQMRERSQDRIVADFRMQLEGKGTGPTDEELQAFARLTHVEEVLRRLTTDTPLGDAATVRLGPMQKSPL